MKTIIAMAWVLLAAAGVALEAQAQYRPMNEMRHWPEGKVILTSGETIYGPLTLYPTQDAISVKNEDGSLSTFSPVNVRYFVAQEQPSGKAYLFRTMLWDMGRDYSDFRKPAFFEQMNQGPLTLLRRETPVSYATSSNYTSVSAYLAEYNPTEKMDARYYMLLPNNKVVTLRNIRRDLFSLFGNKTRKVKAYVKKHHMDFEQPHHLIAIVNYFNTL